MFLPDNNIMEQTITLWISDKMNGHNLYTNLHMIKIWCPAIFTENT
jgi:hypothetical protein